MIKDVKNQYAAAGAITASGQLGDILDHQKGGDALGSELYLVVRVDTSAASSGGNATVLVALETDDAENFGTKVVLLQTAAIAQASVVAKAILLKAKLPIGLKRYSRVYVTVGTENLTAGKFDAFLTPDVEVR